MENISVKVTAKGSFITYINFSDSYQFDLGNGYILTVPINKDQKTTKEFELLGDVSSTIGTQKEIETRLNNFLDWLSFFFNVPVRDLRISALSIEQSDSGKATSTRSITATGAIAVLDIGIDNFQKTFDSKNQNIVLNWYRRCRSEDLYMSFWFIYNILQILIGDRSPIDRYLKTHFPAMKVLQSDFRGAQNTLLIAIRDSFSHKTTYLGQTLDIKKELNSNIDEFRNVARLTIANKLRLSYQ